MRIQEFCPDSRATAHSAADAGHDVCQGQDSCGFQGARGAKSGIGSFVREPLVGGVDVRVLEEGWECPLCEAEALRHGPVALDAGERAEPLLHLWRHVRLAPLCAGLSWLVVTSTIASCRWLVASRFCDCGHHDVLLHDNVFCDCGHHELHRLPMSPPRWWLRPQLFDTAVHGVDELTETLSPFSASGRPPHTTCPDTWPCEQKTCRLCPAPLETGILLQSSMTLRSRTNEKRGERALHGQRIALLQTTGLRKTARSS